MAEILPSAAYRPNASTPVSPLVQRQVLNTIIEDDSIIPRYYFAPRYSTITTSSQLSPQAALMSPINSEDFPTPKANIYNTMSSPQQTSYFNSSHAPSNRSSQTDSDFDDLYDITDDEADVPLTCSDSVKKTVTKRSRSRYPSLIIPSPSAWPTIEKLKSAISPVPPTPSQLLSPSTNALSMLAARTLQVPATSATPSLDGSMTSEEMDRMSCPSTPDRSVKEERRSERWTAPVQLHPQAFETLRHLQQFTPEEDNEPGDVTQLIEVPEGEMQEVSRPQLSLQVPSAPSSGWGSEPVSALSIPSPGGFFSSLGTNARHTWSVPPKQDSMPTTTTAEKFYSLPWDIPRPRYSVIEQSVTLAGSTLDGNSDGPPTSKPVMLSGEEEEVLEVKEIDPSKTIFQYNEKYHAELQRLANANLDRTSGWLTEQDELQALLREMNEISSPKTPTRSHSRGNSIDKSPKKSVRFLEEGDKEDVEESDKPKKTVTYAQGWEYLYNRTRKSDPFIHRQTRAEAMHVRRRCMPQFHRAQILGKFELTNPVRPSPPRPVSEFYTDDPTVLKERIARAQMERQALDQMLEITWVLQALKQLNGGKLLNRLASRYISQIRSPRVLDVGGVPTSDWAWQIAYDYPYSTITTVYTAGHNLTYNVAGPKNHKHTQVPNLWTLPFPSNHFDVVSTRSLHELLKTDKPLGRTLDEYDLCLKECLRCLKPGGFLEYSLIDADIIQAGRQAQAMGVEFGFNLKTRGYDPAPTKSFLPRLKKAGFQDVQRTWMVLPMGKTAANWKETLPVGAEPKQEEKSITPDGNVEIGVAEEFGTTVDAAMVTGMVGAWMYEKWLLKLQMEMGKEEEKLLEGFVQVLEEGPKDGAGWRYLTGFARKR